MRKRLKKKERKKKTILWKGSLAICASSILTFCFSEASAQEPEAHRKPPPTILPQILQL